MRAQCHGIALSCKSHVISCHWYAIVGAQWLIDRGHNDSHPALFELMRTTRTLSEAILGWEAWFTAGDPVATMTHWTERCWGQQLG